MWYALGMAKLDARKLDHKTREALRIRAVQQIEAGESPEVVARALGVHRSAVYQWLARYREGGIEALKFKGIPGRKPKLSGCQDGRSLSRFHRNKMSLVHRLGCSACDRVSGGGSGFGARPRRPAFRFSRSR